MQIVLEDFLHLLLRLEVCGMVAIFTFAPAIKLPCAMRFEEFFATPFSVAALLQTARTTLLNFPSVSRLPLALQQRRTRFYQNF